MLEKISHMNLYMVTKITSFTDVHDFLMYNRPEFPITLAFVKIHKIKVGRINHQVDFEGSQVEVLKYEEKSEVTYAST